MSYSVQLDSGNTRMCSPLRWRPLYRFHSSGRWALGSHWPNSSRKLNTRSLARAFSSSRRAPPKAASNLFSRIPRSSVTVCSGLRDGPLSTTRPASMSSCTLATTSRTPCSATNRSRVEMTSSKLCPVSTCMTGNGRRPGAKALIARCSMTIESLPPENSRTGRSNSAATSRMMWMASASRDRRWLSSYCPAAGWTATGVAISFLVKLVCFTRIILLAGYVTRRTARTSTPDLPLT